MTPEQRWPAHIARLLASIETVARLDILLHLRALRGRQINAEGVASTCNISKTAAAHHLAALCARGFLAVSIGAELLYRYRPVQPAMRTLLDELEELHTAKRDDLIATLRADRRALVAEDDPDMREILRVFLEARGWRSTVLAHGHEAISCAAMADLEVAVVDVRASHGLPLIRTLRERTRAVRTIVTTSFGDERLQSRLAGLGVEAVLEKPFDLEDFARVLDRCG